MVCGLPSSKTWKSSFFRSRTNWPLRVGDERVDLDVLDLGFEGRRLRGAGAGSAALCAPGGACPAMTAMPATTSRTAASRSLLNICVLMNMVPSTLAEDTRL